MNPYLAKGRSNKSTAFINASTGDLVANSSQFRGKRTEPVVARNGEINASSNIDLMKQIQTLINEAQSGNIRKGVTASAEVLAERKKLVEAAMSDRGGEAWQVLGEVIGEEVWETLGREGFARKCLMIKPVGKGEQGRLRIRRKDVTAYQVTQNPNVIASQVRQMYIYPADFYLIGHITIEDLEIEQASGDLLDDKYQDGLEQIMVQEDKIFKRLMDVAAPTSNDLFFFNTFTPTVFSSMRTQVARWGIPVAKAIIAFDLWNDIIADTEFSTWFDPVSKHDIVLEGSLGSILGVELITDAFRYETLQVLNPGECYFLGVPQTLGGITQRKALATESIDLKVESTINPVNSVNGHRPNTEPSLVGNKEQLEWV